MVSIARRLTSEFGSINGHYRKGNTSHFGRISGGFSFLQRLCSAGGKVLYLASHEIKMTETLQRTKILHFSEEVIR